MAATEKDREAVRLCFAAALVDGEIQEEEKKVLFGIAESAGMDMGEISEIWTEIAAGNTRKIGIPRSSQAKRELFENLLSIVLADRVVTKREDRFLRRFAKHLGMESDLEAERENVGADIWPRY